MTEQQQPINASRSLQQKYEMGLRISQGVATIVTMPLEYALRPFFGTRYFDPIQTLFAWAFMAFLPVFGVMANQQMTAGGSPSSDGLLGLGTLSAIFFASHLLHGPRTWRRMIQMEREGHSEFEGDALPFFALLPHGDRFWMVRLVYEPVFVVTVGIVLHLVTILDRPAMIYLVVAGIVLAFKNSMSWYQGWLHLRLLMDAKFAGPLMAKAAAGKATEKELAQVHMAGFPKSVPAEIRTAAILEAAPRMPVLPANIAQLISPIEPNAAGVA
ncbi:MAG TPA: hypothetical protein VFK06_06770 [Candidatus Angelobacter sp.]|nr:hypothetical protein [Candidatus Angelobacter sp.]